MNRRILVIEDDANVSDMLQRWLQELDFSVVAASDGPEGLELFENYRPELVLLDIAMPLMNGFEVASEIRKMEQQESKRRHTPIIVLSAKDLTAAESVRLKETVALVMRKQGFEGERLVDEINSILRQEHLAR